MDPVFTKLEKLDPEKVLSSPFWKKQNDISKYKLPRLPKQPTGKALHAQYEDANSGDLYMPGAKMTAFRVRSTERFLSWIKTFAYRYHLQLGELSDHTCIWVDKVNNDTGPIVEIFIQIFQGTEQETKIESNKLLTFHLYPTTFVITVQGNLHSVWAENEFKYMKSIVDANCIVPSENLLTHDLDSSDNNYLQFVTMLESKNDVSQTNLKVASSPRIIVPKSQSKIHTDNESICFSIQKMEEKICSMSTSLDSNLDNMNSKIEKLSKCEQLIQDLTLKSDNQPADVEQRLEVLENKIFDYINSKLIEIKQEIKTYPKIEEKVFEFENNQSAALEQRLNVLENKIVDYVNLKVTEIKQETKTYSEIEEKVLEFENKFEKFQDKCEHATLVQPKEKQPESQFSQNNYSQLISENQFLRSENMTLKSNLKMLEEKIQSLMEHKRQDVIPQVSTSNSFSLLADHNNNISNDEEETELKAPISNQPHCEIRFVMDSHGNGIDPKRIYKNKDAELIILGKGEKSINGAKNYCDSHSSPKHLVLGVGNNDLEKKSTSTCIADIKYFISAFLEKNEDTTIHVLPAFERVNKATFNSKCADFNTEMKWFCSQNEKCEFIENKLISSLDPSLFSDGIHFSNSGKKFSANNQGPS
ncbi:unnamed protein product [Mytilus edulis]|uniref:Uncharacterized protein n=1 Tax=Mytilus edulis TaxID=6550 RepID=A0A8S3V5C8_MYTED|nr:unnamed protein product [Mytilus edulis]